MGVEGHPSILGEGQRDGLAEGETRTKWSRPSADSNLRRVHLKFKYTTHSKGTDHSLVPLTIVSSLPSKVNNGEVGV